MITDLYNANNVAVGQAAVLIGPADTALPALNTFSFADPFSLAPWQTDAAPHAWNPVGATDGGWQFGTSKSTADITIEEQSTPVMRTMTAQSITIQGTAAEETAQTIALAMNGLVTTVGATAATPGYDEINPTDDVLSYAVALISRTYDGKPKIAYAPRWTQLNNTTTDHRRAAAKHMYPVAFSTISKPNQIRIIKFNAPHT